MAPRLIAWWLKDLAQNTYIYTNFVVGLVFSVFGTFSVYQLQFTGFLIGTDSDGQPCSTYCIVPFGNGKLDLNSALLYMNAFTFGIGGFVTIFIIAYADFWKRKTLLVSICTALYGAFAIPSYWLKDPTLSDFNALYSLYVVFNIVTLVLIALLNIYIPYFIRSSQSTVTVKADDAAANIQPEPLGQSTTARNDGFAMSIFGMLANNISAVLILVIVVVLSATLTGQSQQSAGLLVSTIVGFLTVAAAVGSFLGLPALPVRPWPTHSPWKVAFVELLKPLLDLYRRKNMLFLLLAYTVYIDAVFALGSIISQLYFTELKPSTLEYSLYTLAQYAFFVICATVFFIAHRRYDFKLEKCLVVGYAIILLIPIWGIIGIAKQDSFGNKHRWEFYVQSLLTSVSSALVNPTFRLLYSELIPAGEEVKWFGLQVVLSCATTWVAYVATGPLQNATHNLRFPLILCLVFLLVPLVLECLRLRVGVFRRERQGLVAAQEGEKPTKPTKLGESSSSVVEVEQKRS